MPKTKRHALGQNFLVDSKICNMIVHAFIELGQEHQTAAKKYLEIGPGKGALTWPLIQTVQTKGIPLQELIIAEKDSKLASNWRSKAESRQFPFEITVHEGDFLHPLPFSLPPLVLSNLPYASGTAIFQKLTRSQEVMGMVLMFQAEVAQRIRAIPGQKDERKNVGSLTLWSQNHWEVKKLMRVPARAFRPAPKVASEVLIFTRRDQTRIPDEKERDWEALLQTAFAQRRKMLRKTLGAQPRFRDALERSSVPADARPEALSWKEWVRLFESIPAESNR